jgi:glycosyltransferase involved in cell wall biosynthesis
MSLATRHPKEATMAQQITDELADFDAGDRPVTVSARARRQRLSNALPGLTIVLPCFNEADNVAKAIATATAAAERCASTHQIVVIDDGSSDSTATIAGALAARDPRVHLVVHARNQGYGDAVRSGIAAASEPWILLTDADLQFDLDELERFLPLAGRADLIVGWRIARRDPFNRRINAAAWNWLVRRMFAIPVRDVDCAFKLVRRELVQRLDLRATGAMISTELLVRSLAGGARLEQLGVHHHPRVAGEQSGASVRVVARAFRELLSLRHTLRIAGT